jgi:ArsR family transcriptional regulator
MKEIRIFKALSDPTRLKILESLEKGERCICEIIPYTKKSQPCVSQHLKIIKNAGLINERKDGTKIMIKTSDDEIFKIIKQVKKLKVNL